MGSKNIRISEPFESDQWIQTNIPVSVAEYLYGYYVGLYLSTKGNVNVTEEIILFRDMIRNNFSDTEWNEVNEEIHKVVDFIPDKIKEFLREVQNGNIDPDQL